MQNAGKMIPSGGVEDKLDIWSLRLACLNQILDPWVYIISRVTCCKSQREREPLRSHSQSRVHASSIDSSSNSRRNTVISTVNSSHSSPQCPRKERNLFSRTLGAIRVLFHQKQSQKEYNSSPNKDPETPLRSSAPTQITLADRAISSRCSSSSKLYEDEVYNSSLNKDPETPLKSSAPTQITLADRAISSRCSSSSKLYEDEVC
ncbi:hypothetical protein PoB_002500600 [Plakobranchus ocellatus]|uniref:G-protein coupled receptors family 1 profile domain-containing protein n=1 Tax=Plakobranchus ocellatus TaxID=259542 RepID=A0AAV3ZVE7_9GAST|nr:hypothetical protein PoB_002500600 [Plakobranchus ocellatus]